MIVSRAGLGAIARHEGPVQTIEAVVQAALVAKDVRIGDPAAAARVDPGMKDVTKAGPVAAAVGRSKGTLKLN